MQGIAAAALFVVLVISSLLQTNSFHKNLTDHKNMCQTNFAVHYVENHLFFHFLRRTANLAFASHTYDSFSRWLVLTCCTKRLAQGFQQRSFHVTCGLTGFWNSIIFNGSNKCCFLMTALACKAIDYCQNRCYGKQLWLSSYIVSRLMFHKSEESKNCENPTWFVYNLVLNGTRNSRTEEWGKSYAVCAFV